MTRATSITAPTTKIEIVTSFTAAITRLTSTAVPKPPLDIDDTVDVVHGHQQLAQWNAHYDERCFRPIPVDDEATGAPVTVILRPGKTPLGVAARKLLSRLIGRIRRHWPNTCITILVDGHYAREEAMTWCETQSPAPCYVSEVVLPPEPRCLTFSVHLTRA